MPLEPMRFTDSNQGFIFDEKDLLSHITQLYNKICITAI